MYMGPSLGQLQPQGDKTRHTTTQVSSKRAPDGHLKKTVCNLRPSNSTAPSLDKAYVGVP